MENSIHFLDIEIFDFKTFRIQEVMEETRVIDDNVPMNNQENEVAVPNIELTENVTNRSRSTMDDDADNKSDETFRSTETDLSNDWIQNQQDEDEQESSHR